MGRVAYYPAPDESYSPLDLFRYSSAGTVAANGGAAYLSIDNGTTNLAEFNNRYRLMAATRAIGVPIRATSIR